MFDKYFILILFTFAINSFGSPASENDSIFYDDISSIMLMEGGKGKPPFTEYLHNYMIDKGLNSSYVGNLILLNAEKRLALKDYISEQIISASIYALAFLRYEKAIPFFRIILSTPIEKYKTSVIKVIIDEFPAEWDSTVYTVISRDSKFSELDRYFLYERIFNQISNHVTKKQDKEKLENYLLNAICQEKEAENVLLLDNELSKINREYRDSIERNRILKNIKVKKSKNDKIEKMLQSRIEAIDSIPESQKRHFRKPEAGF